MSKERKKLDPEKWGSKGVACPECGCRDSRVKYVRNGVEIIKRYKVCRHCGYEFETVEKIRKK